MKILAHFSVCLLFMIPVAVMAQSPAIDAALNKGSAADLGGYFAEKVDVSILDNDSSLSSTETVNHISTFFNQNAVKGYKRAHLTAAANGKAGYSLGDLATSTGTYRVYLYYDAKQKISEIRIQK